MDLLHNLLDPKWWLGLLGPFATAGVLGIIFAETGLLLGFFLPATRCWSPRASSARPRPPPPSRGSRLCRSPCC